MRGLHRTGSGFHWCLLLFAAVMLFSSTTGLSQGLYNRATIYVNGVSVYVDGEVRNDGFLENDGHLSFTGDWENEGTYRGSGALEACGHGTQRIFHFNQKVSKFLINGWGTKYINGKINIKHLLGLSAGIVHVSSGDVLRLNEYAVISGGSADSYVDGPITTEGVGYKFFPVGKNGTYAPIELLDVQGKSPEYSVEVFEKAPVISVEDVIVRNGLYWQRKDLAGIFGGTTLGIQYDPQNFLDPANMVVLAGIGWEDPFVRITDVEQSPETKKLMTLTTSAAPILMLGEFSNQWHEADFYLSTALSPNASNPDNRRVKVFGERLMKEHFHFAVFDRWGKVVYESTSLNAMAMNGWDGRSASGAQLANGTYPYRLTAFDKTGNQFEKKGVITIIY